MTQIIFVTNRLTCITWTLFLENNQVTKENRVLCKIKGNIGGSFHLTPMIIHVCLLIIRVYTVRFLAHLCHNAC